MKIIPIRSTNANEDNETCARCGGECCKGMPGIYHPDDLFEGMSDVQIREKIISLLKAGDVVIVDDEIPGSRVYSLSPRTTRSFSSKPWHVPFNYGTCMHLSDSGCRLSSQDRPFECRVLVPNKSKKCTPVEGFDRSEFLEEWLVYEDIMEEVFNYHRENIVLKS